MLEGSSRTPEQPDSPSRPETCVTVTQVSYHGWSDCYLVANPYLEAVVVPSIGRVMQLRRVGQADGVFWENRSLDGRLHDATSTEPPGEWINFGGDKCWPAPQSAWPQFQGCDWPPPAAFDARPLQCVASDRGVTLTSPIDPGFGIQYVRRLQLDPALPVMKIETEYHKIHGDPLRIAAWTITQMQDPERIILLLPDASRFPKGYLRLIEGEPYDLRKDGRRLSLKRNPCAHVKIGSDSTSLLWVGPEVAVRIDTERASGDFPDGGCITEVYTNADPLPYVELETLSPLSDLTAGNSIRLITYYTLMPRSAVDP